VGLKRLMADNPFARSVRTVFPAGVESAPARTPPPGKRRRPAIAAAASAAS
jgi:hypothetical protein